MLIFLSNHYCDKFGFHQYGLAAEFFTNNKISIPIRYTVASCKIDPSTRAGYHKNKPHV
jgi:hypothetical protein